MTDHTITLTDDDAAITVAALLAHAMGLRQAARRHGWQPCASDELCWGCRQRAELITKADRCQRIITTIEDAS